MCIIDTTSKVRHKINIKFEEKSIFSLELLIETLVPQERKCADFEQFHSSRALSRTKITFASCGKIQELSKKQNFLTLL